MAFEGWLLKFGNVRLPNSFLLADGWKSTPNQRLELSAKRNANMLLLRETSSNYKTKLTITVREMNLEEKSAFQNVINQAMISVKERKIDLTYWNDEINEYVHSATGFYIPDITYVAHYIDEDNNDIEYNSFTVTMIEY